MAYINQEEKREIAPVVKAILKKYGQKGTLRIDYHSKLILKLKDVAGMFKFKDEYQRKWGIDINPFWFQDHYAEQPVVVEMLEELHEALKGKNFFDESDPMTDYFHVKHYYGIEVVPA